MKKIFGFNILVNGEQISRAGFEKENSVLSCILSSVRRENDDSEHLDISVSGLNSDTKEYADWFKGELHENDKITIEVISDNFDPPTSIRKAKSEKDIIARKIKQYNKLKEELKEHLS